MRGDLKQALDRQATWQRARSSRSWADKLRMAVILRRAALAIRKAPPRPLETGPGYIEKTWTLNDFERIE